MGAHNWSRTIVTTFSVLLVAVLICACCRKADAPAPAGADATARISVLGMAGVGPNLMERVAGFVAENLMVPIAWGIDSDIDPTAGVDATVAALVKARGQNQPILVAVSGQTPAGTATNAFYSGEAVYADRAVAILGMEPLATAESVKADTLDEMHARRVEKQVVRAFGLLLGLEPCPLTRCALSQYRGKGALDAKGRTLCPPCSEKAWKRLEELGVTRTMERDLVRN
jgi:predicted Zn-dependent protease